MKKAKIAELKNRLSHYLQFVRKGHSVLVYDRDTPIARIEPVGHPAALESADWISELERTGALRPPAKPLPKDWLQRRAMVKADVTQALLDERESGR
jgi:antitoxin (DNA-binding transcriptional repressor) of toxin-antitoxin stability system